ncbi:phosphoribosylanthranilate isomerase [Bradyrhizobium sp. UNPA324]|uniref:phosphoribosylanthranilate isomerase n=1 Tax=Bradyrhizobium sp. UNPA324 TaxID=1141174 RepID=UPI00114EF072|nr:phosphoribosylanthranilate isomerase [Bradyrhizobium sp. UNPA324]
MLTQIYEISTPEEASALSAIGVDHIGVLVGDGQFPRGLSISAASKIGAAIVPPSKFSALFLTRDLSLIASWARELNPAIVHLGASAELLSPQDVDSLKRMLPGIVVMRSIPVFSEESVEIAQSYDGIADFLLLDTYRSTDKQIGALGVTHDWNISRRIVDVVRVPVVLAGGLGLDNVAGAIRTVRPAGVDSKTKTDRDGSHAKDLERVRRFHEAARAAADNRFPSA